MISEGTAWSYRKVGIPKGPTYSTASRLRVTSSGKGYSIRESGIVFSHTLAVVIETDVRLLVIFGALKFIVAEISIEGLELTRLQILILAEVAIDYELSVGDTGC
jgi:hypothetical protein